MSKKLGFFSNINRTGTQSGVVPVFDVTAELSNVAQPDTPDTITFDIDSTLTPAANTVKVYWSTSGGGVSNADFTDGVLEGNVSLDTSGNATVVRQITLVETGASGNVTFEFRTGDPVIGNVIHSQTVDLSSYRYAPFTKYQGDNVDYANLSVYDYTVLYYNEFRNTNDQGELLYSDGAVRLELLPGDKLEISSIQAPTSNTEITDVEVLAVNFSGSSGAFGINPTDESNTSIVNQGGGPGGHVVHSTNVTLKANTYVAVDRIYARNLTTNGKTETGTGVAFNIFNYVSGMGLIDTGILPVYTTAQAANVSANVGDFAIILNTTSYPYYNEVLRYDGANWVRAGDAGNPTLANALVMSRAWTPRLTSSSTQDYSGGGLNRAGDSNVPPEGGGGGWPANVAQTTGIAPIVNNVLQTAYTSGNASVTHGGAGGAGQGGPGGDPDATSGGDGGAGYVSDIRGFGNVQYGAGGAGANGANAGVTYSATNFRRWNGQNQEYETVTAHPPGTGQSGDGILTRSTFNEYPAAGADWVNQGKIYLKWTDFKRFLSL